MSKLKRNGNTSAAEVTEDAAVVRAMYRAIEEGDVLTLKHYAGPEIEWIHPLVTRLPFEGTQRGLTEVLRSAFRRDADGTGPRVSAETFVELGDGVLVVGRLIEDRGAKDEPVEEPFLHECYVSGGRVVRIREYPAESEER